MISSAVLGIRIQLQIKRIHPSMMIDKTLFKDYKCCSWIPISQPLDQSRSQSLCSHFEITKEISEFCPSSFTGQSASMHMPEMVAPRVFCFLTAVQGEWRLWERDCPLIFSNLPITQPKAVSLQLVKHCNFIPHFGTWYFKQIFIFSGGFKTQDSTVFRN